MKSRIEEREKRFEHFKDLYFLERFVRLQIVLYPSKSNSDSRNRVEPLKDKISRGKREGSEHGLTSDGREESSSGGHSSSDEDIGGEEDRAASLRYLDFVFNGRDGILMVGRKGRVDGVERKEA